MTDDRDKNGSAPANPFEVAEIDWLIEPVEVPADNMPWTYKFAGKDHTIYPQAGRFIKVLPVSAAGTQMLMPKIMVGQAMVQGAGESEDIGKAQAGMAMVTQASEDMVRQLTAVIVDWDIIGWDRRLLPKPYRNLSVFMDNVPESALAWMAQTAGAVAAGTLGDTAEDQGKDSRATPQRSLEVVSPTPRSGSRSSASGTGRTRSAPGRS